MPIVAYAPGNAIARGEKPAPDRRCRRLRMVAAAIGDAAGDDPGKKERPARSRAAPRPAFHHKAMRRLAMALLIYLVTDCLALAIVVAVAALLLLV